MSITLYHAPGSCAFAPLVALEEAGADYELRILSLTSGEQRRASYLALNPLGRVPVLVAGDVAITETIAILSWIDATFPSTGLIPPDPLGRAQAYEIAAWIASTAHVALAQVRRPERYASDPAVREALGPPGRAAFGRALDRLEAFAAASPGDWLVGDSFGAVDAYALVVRRWAEGLGFNPAVYSRSDAKARAALARPAVIRAHARERDPTAALAA